MRVVVLVAMGLVSAADALFLPPAALAQTTSRSQIESRALEFRDIQLQTASGPCLDSNLQRSEYATGSCNGTAYDQHHCSDILWHPNFLNNAPPAELGWRGMPYAFGSGQRPDGTVQSGIGNCKGLGNHQCHYVGNHCGYPGCTWSVGVDCSGAVSYAWGISYVGTFGLGDTTTTSTHIKKSALEKGSILNKAGEHSVIVRVATSTTVDILEATGNYPVYREVLSVPLLSYSTYTAYDFKHVVDNQASDGLLYAELREGGSVQLTWTVESARATRYYEFQYQEPSTGAWLTLRSMDFTGPGTYEATYTEDLGGDGSRLVFRVLEIQWSDSGGGSIPHGETRAYAANEH